MKKKGSVCDYIAARDRELLACYRRQLAQVAFVDLDEIFRRMARCKASRFYISEARAYQLIRNFEATGEWPLQSPMRRRMLADIYERVGRLRKRRPGLSLEDAVYETVGRPAPSFYLTPRTCRTIIYDHASRHTT